jgi:hypothetical protein
VMLLCDEVVDTQRCTNALHLQCCRPRLASLPAADCSWLCPVHDGRRRRRRPRAGGAVVDDEISIPDEEFQAQLNDTSDLVNRSVAVPLSERAMKRRYLQSLPIETLFALPMCYSPESLVGRLIMRGYHRAVSNARQRSIARQRASGQDEDEASEGESGCSTEGRVGNTIGPRNAPNPARPAFPRPEAGALYPPDIGSTRPGPDYSTTRPARESPARESP